MENEKTLVLIKPGGVSRGLIGEIIKRFEMRGLRISALRMIHPTFEEIDEHYPKEKEWVTNLGKNTQRSYEEFKIPSTLKEDFETEDLHEIGKEVRRWLVDFMTSGAIVKMVVQCPHAVAMVRKIVGHTITSSAEIGTIRGDFTVESAYLANIKKHPVKNLIHASGSVEEAEREINLWFEKGEVIEL